MPETDKQIIGRLGENIACRFLMKHGFEIVTRNYRRKWGEIDIVARRRENLHFVEVKTVSRENVETMNRSEVDEYRPEDNLHPWKLKRLSRAIESYLSEKNLGESGGWQLDAVTVCLDLAKRVARVAHIENIL
ncbi:MAG: putative endonuclease [Parcubacteria group bacterium Gr01-1014_72]|nr:MAG: putative endonuclease [Parcubacteria group bacterium Gr01-1014_72]